MVFTGHILVGGLIQLVAVTSNSSAKLIMNKQQTSAVSQQSDITGSLYHADRLNRLLIEFLKVEDKRVWGQISLWWRAHSLT